MKGFIFDLSLILVGAAVLSYLAVIFKQPIVVAYIAVGILAGPWGSGRIENIELIETISHLGVTLLLFLAGLCLHPQKLLGLFKKTSMVTFGNCAASFSAAFSLALLFNFNMTDSLCIGLALMFSSTILTVKLLPTTRLHHERMGAVCISVLILQDLLAVAVLAFIRSLGSSGGAFINYGLLLVKLAVFIGVLMLFEQFILRKVMRHVERLHEVLFILGLAWCFGIAAISNRMGLFYETGAFFAGVVLARHPISLFISESLKPLRDFFLVLFFFTLGAELDISVMKGIIFPVLATTAVFVLMKPWLFKKMFVLTGESVSFAKETGIRLGQLSEFSLLIAILAFRTGHITNSAAQFIQFVTIFTFIISSYIVVFTYPTPIGTSDKLIRT